MSDNTKDIHIGEQIGIYKILSLCDYKSNDHHKMYTVQCMECGQQRDVQYRHIKYFSTSCCHLCTGGGYKNFSREFKWKNKRLRRIFFGMKSRCYNTNDEDYIFYGGKGIRVYEEWIVNPLSFEEWAFKNGYKDNLTIDRINPDKDYCPDNCQWLTLSENARRAGKVNWITVHNQTLTGRQWAEVLQIGTNTINTFVREYGKDKTSELIEEMLKKPPNIQQRIPGQTWFSTYGIKT